MYRCECKYYTPFTHVICLFLFDQQMWNGSRSDTCPSSQHHSHDQHSFQAAPRLPAPSTASTTTSASPSTSTTASRHIAPLRCRRFQVICRCKFESVLWWWCLPGLSWYKSALAVMALICHLPLSRRGHWGTSDDFITSFLHFTLFSTALWLSPRLFFCLLCLLRSFTVLARWFWPDLMNGRHVRITSVCISLQWLGGLHVVQLPAGSLHGLPLW